MVQRAGPRKTAHKVRITQHIIPVDLQCHVAASSLCSEMFQLFVKSGWEKGAFNAHPHRVADQAEHAAGGSLAQEREVVQPARLALFSVSDTVIPHDYP